MGKTYRKYIPDKMMRSPKGKKQALINKKKQKDIKFRNKSIPPDVYEDLIIDNPLYAIVERMLDNGIDPDTIAKKLVHKFKMSHKHAKSLIKDMMH